MKTVILAKDSQILTNGGKTLDKNIEEIESKVENPSVATSDSPGVIKPNDDFIVQSDGTLELNKNSIHTVITQSSNGGYGYSADSFISGWISDIEDFNTLIKSSVTTYYNKQFSAMSSSDVPNKLTLTIDITNFSQGSNTAHAIVSCDIYFLKEDDDVKYVYASNGKGGSAVLYDDLD